MWKGCLRLCKNPNCSHGFHPLTHVHFGYFTLFSGFTENREESKHTWLSQFLWQDHNKWMTWVLFILEVFLNLFIYTDCQQGTNSTQIQTQMIYILQLLKPLWEDFSFKNWPHLATWLCGNNFDEACLTQIQSLCSHMQAAPVCPASPR